MNLGNIMQGTAISKEEASEIKEIRRNRKNALRAIENTKAINAKKQDRMMEILSILRKARKELCLVEISCQFTSCEQTIRNDLKTLEKEGYVTSRCVGKHWNSTRVYNYGGPNVEM